MRWLVCVLILIPGTLAAQQVTIQTEPVKVSYYRLPDHPLDPVFKTFSAQIDVRFHDIANSGLTESMLKDQYLRLQGFDVVSGDGDIQISCGIGEFFIWGEFRKSTQSKVDGKIVTRYYLEVKYSEPVLVRVTDRTGNTYLDQYVLRNSDTRSWNSPSYNSLSDLDSYWRIQKQSRLGTLQKELIQEGMRLVFDKINNAYGFREITENTRFEAIGKKGHPLYEQYLDQIVQIRAAFAALSLDEYPALIRSRIDPVLEFYQAEVRKFQSRGKDDTRMRHICLYNQALLYFWLEDYDPAMELVERLLQDDAKDRDARKLSTAIDDVRTALARNGFVSRHNFRAQRNP